MAEKFKFTLEERADIRTKLANTFLYTELGGKVSDGYKFSLAKKGNSGYSFGLAQIDVRNNSSADVFLKSIGVTDNELSTLRSGNASNELSTAFINSVSSKLAENAEKVNVFMADQLDSKITRLEKIINVVYKVRPDVALSIIDNDKVKLAILDYDNQLVVTGAGKSETAPANGLLQYLSGKAVLNPKGVAAKLGTPSQLAPNAGVTAEDILNFKKNQTEWGNKKAGIADIDRRENDFQRAINELNLSEALMDGVDLYASQFDPTSKIFVTGSQIEVDGRNYRVMNDDQLEAWLPGGIKEVRYSDGTGEILNGQGQQILVLTSSDRVMQSDSGQISVARNFYGDGQDLVESISTIQHQQIANNQTATVIETVNALAVGSEIASSKEFLTSGGARIVNTMTADGHIQEDTYALVEGKVTLQTSKTVSYSKVERDMAQKDAALAGLEFIQALRTGNKLQAAGSLIRLVNNAEIVSNKVPTLGAIGTGYSGAVSLISALDKWDQATDGERMVRTARAILGANEIAKAFNNGNGFLDAGSGFTALNVAGGIVALASLEDSIKSGNPFALASSVMAITNSAASLELIGSGCAFLPSTMIAVAIASALFGGLFGGGRTYYPSAPPAGTLEIDHLADGTVAMLLKDADGKVYQTRQLSGEIISNAGKATDKQNWGMGADILSQRMVALIGELQSQAAKDGAHLVLDRLPTLSIHAFPSFDRNGVDNFFFAIRYDNPQTGAQQMVASATQDMAKMFKNVAKNAGAVVDATEWTQIQAKQAAGDSHATETEGQFVDRLSGDKEGDSLLSKSQANAQENANQQTYSLLTLDLEGDGTTRQAMQVAGMSLQDIQADTTQARSRFDVDNDGYMELTDWVGAKEAILGIDRNGDGVLSSANELLSGGELSDAAQALGVKRLAFFDANKDGKLDALDPYFKAFKLWLDINGDARTGIGEQYGLTEAGVRSIDVSTGFVSFTDGQSSALQQTELNAQVRGVAVAAEVDAQGAVIAGQYQLYQEGKDVEMQMTSDAASDLGDILKLVKPSTSVSDAEKAQLKALAEKYGVDLNNPQALLGLGGGGNMAASPDQTTANEADIFTLSQAPNADEIKAALTAFFSNINHDPNAGPALSNKVLQAQEDTQVKIKTADLLAGLTGVQLISVQDARRGRVSLDSHGDVVFDPLDNQHGTAYFTYTASDAQGRTSTAMVWLTIANTNDVPVGVADTFHTHEDTVLSLTLSQLLANDTDADLATDANERLTVTAVANANHGTVRLTNGQVIFEAEHDYQGMASFEYMVADAEGAISTATVQVQVTGENDAPVRSNLTRKIQAHPDALLRIESSTLLAYVNDVDMAYGDSVRLSRIESVSSGSAWQQKDGSILFKASELGDVTLSIEVTDCQGSSVIVPLTVFVDRGNSPQVAFLPGIDQAMEDTAVRIQSTQTVNRVMTSSHGSTLVDQDGTIVFTPDKNYNGNAQVVYEVRNNDGSTSQKTVDFVIGAVNDAPVVVRQLDVQNVDEDGVLRITPASLLATADDVDMATNGQSLFVSRVGEAVNGVVRLDESGHVVFTPNSNFNGMATFTYWVSDNAGASVAAQARVNVRPVNDAPTPLALSFDLFEDERRVFSNASLIANAERVDIDTKTNGDVLKVTAVNMSSSDAAKGSVTVDASGNVTFSPTANCYGTVSFTYTVTDRAGVTGQNTVSLNIAPVNDAPTATSAGISLNAGVEDTVKVISFAELLKNFNDVDGDALTVKSVSAAYGGSVKIENGNVFFTPAKDFNGVGSFNYTVADPSGANASSQATVAFANVNDAPVAAYKRIDGRAYEDTELRIGFNELVNGFYDADGDAVNLNSVRSLGNGSAYIDSKNKQVVFKGNSNFNGLASFEYTLVDTNGAVSQAQKVDVNVIAVNDNPTVRALTGFNVNEDGLQTSNNQDPNDKAWIRIGMNALGVSDVDGDALSFEKFSALNHIAEIKQEGTDAMVLLEKNYSGKAGFNYRVQDGKGGWADGQVNFNVLAQNDAPWLIGLPEWPNKTSKLNGNFNTRIYAFDVDSPSENLRAGIGTYPLHGDVNLSVSTYEEKITNGKVSSTMTVPLIATWDFSFQNHYGDQFNERVGFSVDVWDQKGGSARQYVDTFHQGTVARNRRKPVAIDLNGDGIKYTNVDDSKVLFDINGDGIKDLLAWTAADDGLIVFDKNSDGVITDLDEISFLSYVNGAMTDLDGLNGFDTDKDHKLTAHDERWNKFGVWQDKNQDGITDVGEFKGLDAWGIQSIDLTSDQMMDQVGDVYIMGKSSFERADGTKGEIADTAFRYLDAADTSGATQAKTFNIDIEGVIRQRLTDAHTQGASDTELNAMLQRFISDIANVGKKDVVVEGVEAIAWTDAMYADVSIDDSKSKQLVLVP